MRKMKECLTSGFRIAHQPLPTIKLNCEGIWQQLHVSHGIVLVGVSKTKSIGGEHLTGGAKRHVASYTRKGIIVN